MHILATLSDMTRLAVVVNLNTGIENTIPVLPLYVDSTVQGRPSCRPFGITWRTDELFICNNRQLLVFNKKLEYVRTVDTPLQVNTHQLSYHREFVWAVSPWTNSIIAIHPASQIGAFELNLLKQTVCEYFPRDANRSDDLRHFNSLLWTDKHLFVSAHTFGEGSYINQYGSAALKLECVRHNVGAGIHGLAHDNERLYWISSGTEEIRSSSGYAQALSRGGYARGFAMTRDYFIVAISQFKSRDQRSIGDSWIQIIDRVKGTLVHELHLPDTGSINDIRLLDEYDYAHRIDPFWRKADQKLPSVF
jgi:hypothetical protein